MSYDVIVIGAGVIGLGIGWRTQQLGLRTLILDRAEGPSGASRVAAGMLAPVTEAGFGEEQLLRLNLESARRYPAFLEELEEASGRRIEPVSAGTVFVALNHDQSEVADRLYEYQRSLGLEVERLDAASARSDEPMLTPSTQRALLARSDREIDPRELVAGLMTAFTRAGGELRLEAEVSSIENGPSVVLAGGENITGGQIVVAAGCWSGKIAGVPKEVTRAVRPVKGQLVRLVTSSDLPILRHVIRTEDCYVVPRRNGEVVVGATVEEKGFDTTVTAEGVYQLLRAGIEVLPSLREASIGELLCGLRPGSRDNSPLLGMTSVENVVAATGHYRNGILLTPITADSISTLLAKGDSPEEISAFDPRRFS